MGWGEVHWSISDTEKRRLEAVAEQARSALRAYDAYVATDGLGEAVALTVAMGVLQTRLAELDKSSENSPRAQAARTCPHSGDECSLAICERLGPCEGDQTGTGPVS